MIYIVRSDSVLLHCDGADPIAYVSLRIGDKAEADDDNTRWF